MNRKQRRAKRFAATENEKKGALEGKLTKKQVVEKFKSTLLAFHFMSCDENSEEPFNFTCRECGKVTMFGQQPSIFMTESLMCLQDDCLEKRIGDSEEFNDLFKYLQ